MPIKQACGASDLKDPAVQMDPAEAGQGALSRRLETLANSSGFQTFIVGVILFSSMLVGFESIGWMRESYGDVLRALEGLALAVFLVELGVRIGAYGKRPWRFFQAGWNLFDFIIIALCFLPQAQFAAVLRLLRVLRILRLLSLINRANQAEIYRLKHEELTQAHQALLVEQDKSECLLLNILPQSVAQRLKQGEALIADSHADASVLFADIVGFTDFSTRVTPEALVSMLDQIFSRFDELAERLGLEKIKTIGDAYMVVAGLPDPMADHPRVLVDMGLGMLDAIAEFNQTCDAAMDVRIGVHTGPVVAGVIGRKKFSYDLWGDTVNIASRMESHGAPGRVQVTDHTRSRLPRSYQTEPRGRIKIKGRGEIEAFLVRRPPDRGGV